MSIPEKLRYGAAELKAMYNRNLGLALAISVGVHLALIGIYIFGLNIGKAGSDGKTAPIAKIKLTNIAPPPPTDNAPPPPPPIVPPELQTGGGGGVAARAGNPVPVPDALIAPDVKEFATMTEVAVATPEGGDGTGFAIDTDLGSAVDIGSGVQVATKEEIPEPDEFIPVEKEPNFDYSGLQARVKYPEIARKNGIEGQVVLQVYVSKTGKPTQIRIAHSDSKFFDEPAKDAVMQTSFTPAVQNGTPIGTWVTIPLKFQLN